jgi:hypothetical protein
VSHRVPGMGWLVVLILVLALLALTAIVSGLIFTIRFSISPEWRWRTGSTACQ